MAPVIGVTATLKEDDTQVADTRPLGVFVRADLDYVNGVAQAGGVPVVLPPVAPEAAETMIRGIDGLLLSGGSDLHPSYYGEKVHPELGPNIPERDAFEMQLLELALSRGLPIFGICRGLQLINVALGGTLYQDLPAQFGEELDHRQDTPKWSPKHAIEFDGSSTVGGVSGCKELQVNSYHHQAIKDVAYGLDVCARSADGVVEAIEGRDFPERWLVGVQWHAEAMRASDPAHRNLFAAHIAAAERHALRRRAVA